MHYQTHVHHVSPLSYPELRTVEPLRPLQWLAAGWTDLVRTSGIGLGYGLTVVLLLVGLLVVAQAFHAYYLAIALVPGFALIGPVLAVGLYEVARRRELEISVSLPQAWAGWRRNPSAVLGVGLVLVMALLVWAMLTMMLTVWFSAGSADVDGVLGAASVAGAIGALRWPMLLAAGVAGAIVAAVVFLLTAVSVPLVFERRGTDLITAMVISTRCVLRNRGAMALWAILVGLISALAATPLFLGLVVAFPLLAYATWHAYRDLVGE